MGWRVRALFGLIACAQLPALGCASTLVLRAPATVESAKDWAPVTTELASMFGRRRAVEVEVTVEPPHRAHIVDGKLRCLSRGPVTLRAAVGGRSAQVTTHCEVKVCAVLSVGGVAGLAHIGGLQALKEAGVPIDCVYGNSMGAVVGGLYAAAPDAPPGERLGRVFAAYLKRSHRKAKKNAAIGFLIGAGLMVASGGALGWESIAAGAAGAVAGAKWLTKKFDNERFAKAYREVVNGVAVDDLPVPFGTSWLRITAAEQELIVVRDGDLATAVANSANNPFIWRGSDLDLKRLDPGVDRMEATPVATACAWAKDAALFVLNVTGKPAVRPQGMVCPVSEIMLPRAEQPAEALMDEAQRAEIIDSGRSAVRAYFASPRSGL
jgi:predicted acylesterase/phospholipase RssA